MSSPRWFAVLAGLLLAASARTDDPRPAATPATSRHWAFRPPVRVSPPRIAQPQWAQNPIDAFILHPLEGAGIAPSAEAARATLLRRVSLDLTGLPPTPPELDAFLNDDRPDAYGRAVDRLLASPHFGERWGRHWLDAARYADSHGYSIDAPRSIWPWRDWVVRSLNQDLPFDDFVTDQLAGDLRPDATLDQRVATGFHRNTQINEEGGIDPEQFRIEAVLDRVGTTGTVLLGLTIACAQCHDHKYDPISQREYFRLYAFFNSQDEPSLEVAPVGESAARQGTKPPTTLVLRERSEPRASFVFIKGDFTRRGDDVTPGTPAILPPLTLDPTGPGIDPSTASRAEQTPNRLDLARWLVSPSHPLTARVMVNRIWQQYFGHGLVETENDFGTQGSAPTHPELLDWLATELAGTDPVGSPHRWRLKHLHRLIVTSATYRQRSSAASVAAQTRNRESVDPLNRLLSRQNRIRLEGEVIRDVALAASGHLNPAIGGPPVFPPQPEGVMALGQSRREWRTSVGGDRYRRGIYTFRWRATPHPALSVFDTPDAFSACTRRLRSNTPLQALTLLNDEAYLDLAEGLADRLQREAASADRLDLAFRICLSRPPSAAERQRLESLLDAERRDGDERMAWITVARVLLNLDETITRE